MARSATRVLALALGLALLAPASAIAHAQLEGSSPERGEVAGREPGAVVFRFDEPVEGSFGAVRAYDADGERVDAGDAFHPDGEGTRLGVHLEPGLAEGSYTATYRVVSADGHIVAGGFVFAIGRAGRAPVETVAELAEDSDSGLVTETAFGVARGLQYAAAALAVGGLAFLLLAWLPGLAVVGAGGGEWPRAARAFAVRLRALFILAATLGATSAVAGVVLEGAQAAGVSGFSALNQVILRETLETRFGTVWGLAALAWIAFGLAVAVAYRPATARQPLGWGRSALLGLPLGFAVLVPALSGHASTQPPLALLFPANVVHVTAMAVWLGGLAALLLVAPRGTRELGPDQRGRLLAAILSRFSRVALAAVGAILLTGLAQAYVYVRHLDNLVESGYGRAVLAKFCLLLALIGIGAYNHRRSVPRLNRIATGGESPGRAGLLLRRALRAEVALLAVVLGVTGALAGYAPPVSARSGPFSAETTLGPTQLEMTVDPARVGANTIHVYLFDSRSGAPYERAKQFEMTATLPEKGISLPLEPQLSGPGHYTIPGAPLNAPGDWRLGFTVRVSAFNQFTKKIEVPVR